MRENYHFRHSGPLTKAPLICAYIILASWVFLLALAYLQPFNGDGPQAVPITFARGAK